MQPATVKKVVCVALLLALTTALAAFAPRLRATAARVDTPAGRFIVPCADDRGTEFRTSETGRDAALQEPRMRSLYSALILATLAPMTLAQQPGPPQPPPPAPAPPKLNVPAEVHVPLGTLAQILIVTESPQVKLHYVWVGAVKAANVFREFDEDPTHVAYQVLGTKPGTCYLVVFAVRDNQAAKAVCTVIVDPPDPGPQPAPAPAPPAPTPPGPQDPLTQSLQAAYTADPAAFTTKAATRLALINLYQGMQQQTQAGSFATLADVRKGLTTAAAPLNLGDGLLEVRKLIAAEIAAAMGPAPDARLEPTLKAKMATTFGRVTTALAALK